MFLIPIGSDRRFRKFPIITLILIIIFVTIFILTDKKIKDTKKEILLIEQKMQHLLIEKFQYGTELQKINCRKMKYVYDLSLMKIFSGTYRFESEISQQEYLCLYTRYEMLKKKDPLLVYGFDPKNPSIVTAFSSIFIHNGVLHLLFNLWFLFLFGALIEDFLGKYYYPIFLFFVSVATNYFHCLFGNALILGSSGLIAGLMAAFLILFFKANIQYFFTLFGFWNRTFFLKAYYAFPLWFAMEFFKSYIYKNSEIPISGQFGGFLSGFLLIVIIRFTPLYTIFKDRYFASSTKVNPKSYIDDIDELISKGKLKEALNLTSKALVIAPEYIPLFKEKITIYKLMDDMDSLFLIYKPYFKLLIKKGVNFSAEFLEAYSRFKFKIIDKGDYPIVLSNLINDDRYKKVEKFSHLLKKRISDKNSKIYSEILINEILALINLKKYDQALIRLNEGFLLNEKNRSEIVKYKELRIDLFSKKFDELSFNLVLRLIKLDDFRLKKMEKEFLTFFEKLSGIKNIKFTFGQFLYYAKLLTEKHNYTKAFRIYTSVIKIYKDHSLKYVVYYRMAHLFLIRKNKKRAIKYYKKALFYCNNKKRLLLISKELHEFMGDGG